MSRLWDSIFKLDEESSICAEEEDLGKEKLVYHKHKPYLVMIPQKINKKITLRLRGFGKKRFHKTGNLYLHVWLNKGEDINKRLWLSETYARNGAEKKLFTGEKTIAMIIPPNCHHGLTIRLKGFGREPNFGQHVSLSHPKKRGNLLVELMVFPDSITPRYGSFDSLSTENMALEGWVYRKFDEVISKVGRPSLPTRPLQANEIADLFNESGGYKNIFDAIVNHLKLAHLGIKLTSSTSIALPGNCERTVTTYANNNNAVRKIDYKITINEQFIDNPFSITAILAHELCHVLYSEKIDDITKSSGYMIGSGKATLEEERTVDLLVFMFKMGEFQLRVARDQRLSFGYFNQEIFERIQIIVSRKLSSFQN